MHRNHIGRGRDVDDGREIGERVVRDLGIDGRVGGGGRNRRHAQRVAVRRRARGFGGPDHAAPACLVLDHHGLAQGLAQRLGHHAGNDVGRSAGRERDDEANRLGRIRLRARAGAGRREQGGDADKKDSAVHQAFSGRIDGGRGGSLGEASRARACETPRPTVSTTAPLRRLALRPRRQERERHRRFVGLGEPAREQRADVGVEFLRAGRDRSGCERRCRECR